MKAEFWHEKWKEKSIGFHQDEINPYLQKHLGLLQLKKGDHLFVPLCGKSRDMAWLAQQGYRVTGIELSEIAVREFFEESNQTPEITNVDAFRCFSAGNVTILCGDFFELKPQHLPGIVSIYDRAALIALPTAMRDLYVKHLQTLVSPTIQMLLITLEYPVDSLEGPPFSIPANEVEAQFAGLAKVSLLQTEVIEFKEIQSIERSWLIEW